VDAIPEVQCYLIHLPAFHSRSGRYLVDRASPGCPRRYSPLEQVLHLVLSGFWLTLLAVWTYQEDPLPALVDEPGSTVVAIRSK
jgi:hypothetical protein